MSSYTYVNNMYISLFVVIFIASFDILTDEYSKIKIMRLLKRPIWLLATSMIVLWSIIILVYNGKTFFIDINDEDLNKYQEATKKAILAFIIAVFAYIENTIPVYWLVWIIAFYLDDVV